MRLRLAHLMGLIAVIGLSMPLLGPFGLLGGLVAALPVVGVWLVVPGRLRLLGVSALAALSPLIAVGWMYLAYLAAWAILGHRPRIYLDDPKNIHPMVSLLNAAAFWWMILWPGMPLAGATLGGLAWSRDDPARRWRLAWYVFLPIAGWCVSLLLLVALARGTIGRAGIGRLVDWWFD